MILLVVFVQIILILILIACWLYFASMMISDLFGVPFVPTRNKNLQQIFNNLEFEPKDIFYDLGSGDGRLVFYIAKTYGIRAIGIELNPLLYLFSQLKKKLTNNHLVTFYRRNFFDLNLAKATVIYLFLFPEVVEKLYPQLIKQCQKNTLIVSHGFKIKQLAKRNFLQLQEKPFKTYFYRL